MTKWTLKQANGHPQVVGFWPVPQGYHEHAWGKPHLHVAYQKVIKKTGKTPRRPEQGRKRSVWTPRMTKAVVGKILRNPARSMNKMTQEYNVSAKTIERLVKADLCMKPFKYRKINLLNEVTRAKRKARSKLLLKWYAVNPSVVVIFYDEKLFETTKKFNPQNDRILEYHKRLPDAETGICDGLGTVVSNGKKSPLLWIPDGVKIYKIVYLDFLKTKVFP
ncbi:Putative MhmaT1 transposase, partial [Caligus rogercresseyi]